MSVEGGRSAPGLALTGVSLLRDRVPPRAGFPFSLPFLAGEFDLAFDAPVTLFVGENGTGKSTLLESIAVACRLPAGGGGPMERTLPGEASGAGLATALRPRFRRRPRDGFFLRTETLVRFADALEDRDADPFFLERVGSHGAGIRADPYALYGGTTLHARSHGEAFLAVVENRMSGGLYLFDEPESALSPQRQLRFARLLDERVRGGGVQVLMATHAPLLMTIPGARILLFDGETIRPCAPEETPHWRTMRAVLADPRAFWEEASGPESAGGT